MDLACAAGMASGAWSHANRDLADEGITGQDLQVGQNFPSALLAREICRSPDAQRSFYFTGVEIIPSLPMLCPMSNTVYSRKPYYLYYLGFLK